MTAITDILLPPWGQLRGVRLVDLLDQAGPCGAALAGRHRQLWQWEGLRMLPMLLDEPGYQD
jgi:hypothetical protein